MKCNKPIGQLNKMAEAILHRAVYVEKKANLPNHFNVPNVVVPKIKMKKVIFK